MIDVGIQPELQHYLIPGAHFDRLQDRLVTKQCHFGGQSPVRRSLDRRRGNYECKQTLANKGQTRSDRSDHLQLIGDH